MSIEQMACDFYGIRGYKLRGYQLAAYVLMKAQRKVLRWSVSSVHVHTGTLLAVF